jgi:trehalose 6-phosphate synthase
MDSEEMVERMRHMRRSVKEHNIYWWAASLIGTLSDVRLEQKGDANSAAPDYVSGVR